MQAGDLHLQPAWLPLGAYLQAVKPLFALSEANVSLENGVGWLFVTLDSPTVKEPACQLDQIIAKTLNSDNNIQP
jgi:hypothetical protein